jgi:D-xylose transport system substrate-binding protein
MWPQLASILLAAIMVATTWAHARAGDSVKVGLLLPCTLCTDRFEQKDRSLFLREVASLDPSAVVLVTNAEGETRKQLAQAEADLAQGAAALVVVPVESRAAASVVEAAHREKASVIAYDGMIMGALPDAYVSFDNHKVGALEVQYAVAHSPAGAPIALINGDQSCDPCRAFKRGAHAVLDPLVAAGKIKLVYETDAKDWLAANAQRATEEALTLTNDRIDAIIAANDTLAQGVIAALTEHSLAGKVLVTGQDATDAAIMHILEGAQTMTVYKPLALEAAAAAKGALDLARGDDITSVFPDKVRNDRGEVPSLLLTPVVVDRSNIAATVIRDGYTRRENVCKGAAEAHCDF